MEGGRYGVDPHLDAEIEDLEVATSEGPRRLSSLFGGHDDLLLVHNMGRTCAYCTLWADGFVGLLPHLIGRSAVALLTPDPPEVQRAFAESRGWPFVMASDPTRAVARALGFATEAGFSLPGVSALRRSVDGSLVRTGRAEFGPGDDYCAVWQLFDLLEGGSGDWAPRI